MQLGQDLCALKWVSIVKNYEFSFRTAADLGHCKDAAKDSLSTY